MNRIDKRIATRVRRGKLPLAYSGWDGKDVSKICPCLTTKPYDYTRMGGIVIFEQT